MATFDLAFSPRDTIANPPAIKKRAEELYVLQARMFGQSDDLDASFNSAATQFTDIFAWNIQGLAAEDYQLWREAGVAIAYAASQIEQWAAHVEEFKKEREEQTSEWFDFRTAKEDEIPADYQGQTITATYPERGGLFGISDASKCRDIYDEVAAKLAELIGRANTNYQNFENNAEEIADNLKEGPTKANVQELIDAGINSWAFYNIDPNHYTMLVDGRELTEENAEEWADELSDYWSGDKPLDERYNELMLMMSMITTNAMQAQQGGTGYRTDEMDFLRTFYETLEEESPNHMGVVGIPVQMEGDHLTNEEREHALGMLGDGLLALSDPDFGGGYGDLPQSVRDAIDIPFTDEEEIPGDLITQEGDARTYAALSELFAHTNDDMKGGYGLSTRLSLSAGAYIGQWGDSTEHWVSSEEIGELVDVAARNKDANYYMLTGEHLNSEEGVDYTNDKPTDALENLLTYEWHDDGADIRGLTDWLAEDGNSDNTEIKERADRALSGFIEVITRPDVQEALIQTGNQVEDTRTTEDEEGNEVTEEFTWRNVSMGHLNPEIADSFADIFDTYIDTFADSNAIDENNALDESFTTGYDPASGLRIELDDRRFFASMIAGSPEAASQMFSSTQEYIDESVREYFTDEQAALEDHAPRRSGLLLNAVMSGIADEAVLRSENHNAAVDRNEKLGTFAIDMMAPSLKNAYGIEAFKIIAKEYVEMAGNDLQTEPENTTTKEDVSLIMEAQVKDEVFNLISENDNWDGAELPEEMLTGGDFINNPSQWDGIKTNDEANGLRNETWKNVRYEELEALPPETDIGTHFTDFMDAMNGTMRISTEL
ncbi:TPR repeat region-containing protein [Nocardiopsis halotolerans]|uniref:TPR repeat region-containing protein n=1 Tax=Nocardiopsis halotolerans TaxID=124252 RepID=UPI00034B7C39|nr:hypothetical protein [Nocardiopsis halotolerans]